MPIFTQPITLQNQASQSGFRFYPSFPSVQANIGFGDTFNRESLNVTNAYALYTVGVTGAGTANIWNTTKTNSHYLRAIDILTSSSLNDDVDVRTSGYTFERKLAFTDQSSIPLLLSSIISIDIVFTLNSLTSLNFFVGALGNGAHITSLPTTDPHMGLFADTTGTGNFVFSNADGTNQKTTDTGVPIDATTRLYRVVFNGTSIIHSLYSDGLGNTLQFTTSHTTNFPSSGGSYELHFFMKTLTTAAKEILIKSWRCYYS